LIKNFDNHLDISNDFRVKRRTNTLGISAFFQKTDLRINPKHLRVSKVKSNTTSGNYDKKISDPLIRRYYEDYRLFGRMLTANLARKVECLRI